MPLDAKDASRLKDMLAYAQDAVALLGAHTQEQMLGDLSMRLALVRCVEVIGEAGHQVSLASQSAMPTIPWHAMWGMRNRLIHDYGNTNYRLVYSVVHDDLPGMVSAITAFLAQHLPC